MADVEELKWYSGGAERGQIAMELISDLISRLDSGKEQPLRELLFGFYREIKAQESSVPYVMNQMNIELAQCMLDNGIVLSEENRKLMKQLQTLRYIRYGSR